MPDLLRRLLLILLLITPVRHSDGSDFQLNVSTHGLYSHLGEGVGASWDMVLAATWVPVEWLAVGLEGALIVPLRTGEEPRKHEMKWTENGVKYAQVLHEGSGQQTSLTMRVNPAVWLIYGDDQAWGYVKVGAGMDSHLRGGSLEPVLALVGAAGFAVAPRELVLHFGFEVFGELEIAGDLPTRAIGVGGIVGWRF